ncbi:unnamed protein product, partial [marine sediment metagenome]
TSQAEIRQEIYLHIQAHHFMHTSYGSTYFFNLCKGVEAVSNSTIIYIVE